MATLRTRNAGKKVGARELKGDDPDKVVLIASRTDEEIALGVSEELTGVVENNTTSSSYGLPSPRSNNGSSILDTFLMRYGISISDVATNLSAEFKVLLHHTFDIAIIFPSVSIAYFMGNLATQRHETAHQFCAKTGLYQGLNTANDLAVGTDLDQFRLKDFGFQNISEQHSEALASIVDIIPSFMFFCVFPPMFIASVCRKFDNNDDKHSKKYRMFMSCLTDGFVHTAFWNGMRFIFYMATALPAPDRECVRGLRDWVDGQSASSKAEGFHHNPTCGDLIFSGHFATSYSFFMFYVFESHRFFSGMRPAVQTIRYIWGGLVILLIVFQVYGILATRHHYSIDIVFVPFVDYCIRWGMLKQIGLGYDRLENRAAILYSKFGRFRLFGQSFNNNIQRGEKDYRPSRRVQDFFIVLFIVILATCAVGVLFLLKTMFDKVHRVCQGSEEDQYCQFVHHNIMRIYAA